MPLPTIGGIDDPDGIRVPDLPPWSWAPIVAVVLVGVAICVLAALAAWLWHRHMAMVLPVEETPPAEAEPLTISALDDVTVRSDALAKARELARDAVRHAIRAGESAVAGAVQLAGGSRESAVAVPEVPAGVAGAPAREVPAGVASPPARERDASTSGRPRTGSRRAA